MQFLTQPSYTEFIKKRVLCTANGHILHPQSMINAVLKIHPDIKQRKKCIFGEGKRAYLWSDVSMILRLF